MEAREFDKNARSQLSKHESRMDVDSFWDKLEPELPTDKSQPKALFLFLLLGLLLCSSLLGWYLVEKSRNQYSNLKTPEQKNHKSNSVQEKTESVATSIITSNANGENVANHTKHESQLNSAAANQHNNRSKSSNLDQVTSLDKNLINSSGQKNTAIKNKDDLDIEYINHFKIKNSNYSNQGRKKRVDKQEFNSGPLSNNGNFNSNGKIANQSGINDNGNQDLNSAAKSAPTKNVSYEDSGSKDDHQSSSISALQEIKNEQGIVAIVYSTEDPEKAITTLNPLPGLLALIPVKGQLSDLTLQFFPPIENVQPVMQPKKTKCEVLLLPVIGIGYFDKKLTSSGNDAISNYTLLRNQAESNLEEWLFGLNIKVVYKHIGLLTGIEYILRNERFRFTSTKEENYFGSTAIRVENSDTISFVSGAGWYGSSQTRKVVQYNFLRQWNVPLGLTYVLKMHSLRFELAAGAVFSIKNQIIGNTLDSGLNVADWNQSTDLSYKTNLGIGWFGDLSCSIPLTNFLACNTGFRVQEFPENYLNGPLRLCYRSYYFKLGLLLSLN